MSEQNLSEEILAVERALGSLKPAPSRINRDQLMFQAGQASAGRRSRVWPAASLVMALLAVTLGVLLLSRPAPEPRERIIYVTQVVPQREPVKPPLEQAVAAAPEKRLALGEMSYLRLRDKVLAQGVDALPSFSSGARERETLEDLLGPQRLPAEERPELLRSRWVPLNWGGKS